MTDREKHLSLALDALVTFEDYLTILHNRGVIDLRTLSDLSAHAYCIRRNIEAAALPKPSIIRRWFGKREAA